MSLLHDSVENYKRKAHIGKLPTCIYYVVTEFDIRHIETT
jgi:hypothetical protein